MEFFKQFTGRKEEIHREICRHMSFEYYTTGKIIFYQGDIPDKFYMLLKGKIAVLIRKSEEELKFLNIQYKNPPKSKSFLTPSNLLTGQKMSDENNMTIRRRLIAICLKKSVRRLLVCLKFFSLLAKK